MAVSFKGAHFPKDVILTGVLWYVAYPLSTRHVEELMEERGVTVDHATMDRWVIKYGPQLEEAFHCRKRPVWISWRLDETVRRIGCMEERRRKLPALLGEAVRPRLSHTRKGAQTPKGGGDRRRSGKAVREAKLSSRPTAASGV
jgi:transposase-like protein